MILYKATELAKSKYISRRKGTNGKWIYEYHKDSSGRGSSRSSKEEYSKKTVKNIVASSKEYKKPMAPALMAGIADELSSEINDVFVNPGASDVKEWFSVMVKQYGFSNVKGIMKAGLSNWNDNAKEEGYTKRSAKFLNDQLAPYKGKL